MLKEFFFGSEYFGLFISILGFYIGVLLKKRVKSTLFNPLLAAIFFVIVLLLVFDIDYETYNSSARYLTYLITPATICLAVPLYKQLETLKANLSAIAVGIATGVLATSVSVLLLSALFSFPHEIYITLLPKSTTTAIGIGISKELGGIVPLTVIAIVITGNIGNLAAVPLCRLFRLEEPVARGIAIGSASHVIGTVKAFEIGEVEGAMSSLAIILAGLLTVVAAPFFATLF